jgi:CrcB protein
MSMGVLAVVAAGGALGALTRYGIEAAVPTPAGGFPWATFGINVAGCAAIGALMVLILEGWRPHPLLRPFLTVGLLGGFTTFSAYAVEARVLLAGGHPALAVAYVVGTVLAALLAVHSGATLTRRVLP